MIISTITAREMLRNYKQVFERVKKSKQPTVVVSKKKPQVAIVSLNDFNKLQEFKYKNSAKELMELAKKVREVLKDEKLPSDLSTRHDYYLYEESHDK